MVMSTKSQYIVNTLPSHHKNTPFVSVIVPCRNEEEWISKCLDSILANTYPKDRLEILVIDGQSEDRSVEIIQDYVRQHPEIILLQNPRKNLPAALNVGIRHAKGEIIVRMESHSAVGKEYISTAVDWLGKSDADYIGGPFIHTPREPTYGGQALALILAHPFGAGNAWFRLRVEKPRYVDSAVYGCYRKKIFDTVGLFNEDLARIEDRDFNFRLRACGGKILLVPDLPVTYYFRSKLLPFLTHTFSDGFWVTYPLRFGLKNLRLFSWRHCIPLLFLLGLLVMGVFSFFFQEALIALIVMTSAYVILMFFSSLQISLKHGLRYFPILPCTFAGRHMSYALGSAWGLVTLLGIVVKTFFKNLTI